MNTLSHLPQGLKHAILCLRISIFIYAFLAFLSALFVAAVFLGAFDDIQGFNERIIVSMGMGVFVFISVGMAVFIEIVCRSLKQGRYWAWVAALILCGTYIPSLFVVLGIVGLIGLLKPDAKSFCEKKS